MKHQRNYTLEIIKLFASYMVVIIHFYFQDGVGIYFDAFARFAVPLFFVVSGFYSYQISLSKIKKRIMNLVYLSLFSTLVYTAFNIARLIVAGNVAGISSYFGKYLNANVLIRLFVFNIPISSEHLWFLFALIYVYVIFYLVTKYKISVGLFLGASALLLFTHILLGEFSLAINVDYPAFVVRNFIFMGVPFFSLGLIAKKYAQKITQTPIFIIIISFIIGIIGTYFSRKFIGKNELYIGSLFLCFSCTALFIKYSHKKYPKILVEISSCNTYIYILHIAVISVVELVYRTLKIKPLSIVSYLIVCAISTVLAYLTNELNKKFKSSIQKAR